MRALIESILGTIRMKLIEVGAVALILILLTLMWCGCGAIRTKVEWQIGEGEGVGWIQGPGSASAKIVKTDGTTIDVEIERPPLWSANVPQVIQLRDSP